MWRSERAYKCFLAFNYGWYLRYGRASLGNYGLKDNSGCPITNAMISCLAQLADNFVLSIAELLLEANCVLHWVGVMLLAMEQLDLLPLFYSTSTPLGSRSLWTLLDVNAIVQAKFLCATNQEVWSKINVHPSLFAFESLWVTFLGVPVPRYHLRSVVLPNVDLLILQVLYSRWSVLCRLSWCSMYLNVDGY